MIKSAKFSFASATKSARTCLASLAITLAALLHPTPAHAAQLLPGIKACPFEGYDAEWWTGNGVPGLISDHVFWSFPVSTYPVFFNLKPSKSLTLTHWYDTKAVSRAAERETRKLAGAPTKFTPIKFGWTVTGSVATKQIHQLKADYAADHWGRFITILGAIINNPKTPSAERHRAEHLIGILANLTGAPQSVAARLAEINTLLAEPEKNIRASKDIAHARHEALGDAAWIYEFALGWGRHSEYTNNNPAPLNCGQVKNVRTVINTMVKHDPILDYLRVLTPPKPFIQDKNWQNFLPIRWRYYKFKNEGRLGTRMSPMREKIYYPLIAYARNKWLATNNPLWAYALAVRTENCYDIQNLKDAIARLSAYPNTGKMKIAKEKLTLYLKQQTGRLYLTCGETAKALNLVKADPQPRLIRYLATGGVRYFLDKRHFNLAAAQDWASEMTAIWRQHHGLIVVPLGLDSIYTHNAVDRRLRMILSHHWSHVIKLDGGLIPKTKTKMLNYSELVSDNLFFGLNILTADHLIRLSAIPNLSPQYQKILFIPGWTRLYILGHRRQVFKLLPRLRQVAPSLAPDISQIEAAWTSTQKWHLTTLMVLKNPGFSPFVPMVAFREGLYSNYNRLDTNIPNDHFPIRLDRIASGNPNSGNWWCVPDPSGMRFRVVQKFIDGAVKPRSAASHAHDDYSEFSGQTGNPLGPVVTIDFDDYGPQISMRSFLKKFPLFKNLQSRQLSDLSVLPASPQLLTNRVLNWSKHSTFLSRWLGLDAKLPEALHDAVRVTRFACPLSDTHGPYSRAAFHILHRDYPHSIWTKKTPYWFARSNG